MTGPLVANSGTLFFSAKVALAQYFKLKSQNLSRKEWRFSQHSGGLHEIQTKYSCDKTKTKQEKLRKMQMSRNLSKLCLLKSRSVIKVAGNQSSEFLQGLMTNDINHLDESKAIYSMFLNTQGRVLFDTFLVRRNPEEYFIDVDSKSSEKLIKQLKLYKVRRKIDICKDENQGIYASFGGEEEEKEHFFRDVRVKNLGLRGISDKNLDTNCNER